MAIIQMEAGVRVIGHEELHLLLSEVADLFEKNGLKGVHIRVKPGPLGGDECTADIAWQGAILISFEHAANADKVIVMRPYAGQDVYPLDGISDRLYSTLKERAISVVTGKVLIFNGILAELKFM